MNFQTIKEHKILSVLSAIFAVLLLGIVCLVLFSAQMIRSMTEKKGSDRIGRTLVIEGPLKVDWHWNRTSVHAEKIRLGNAEGYKEPDMLNVEALDFTFKPAKLLLGRLEFGDITITKPTLVLDKKSATEKNWDFPALSNAKAAAETVTADSRHNFPIIGTLTLKDGRLIYRDAVKGLDLDLKLDTISGNGGTRKEKGFTITGNGTLQNQKFTIDAHGGSLSSLRDTKEKFPLTLSLAMGPTKIDLDGTFEDPVKMTGVDSTLSIKGNNMADLFYLTAIPLPPTPPYTLTGKLTKVGDVWSYNGFDGRVGGSDLSGDLSYDTSGERGFLKADLHSKLLDSRDLGGFIGLSPSGKNAAPEQKTEAAKKKARAKIIPDVPISLERLRATDMDVTLNAKRIEAPGLPFKGMNVRFDLQNGVLKLNPLDVVLADGSVKGTVEIDGQKEVPPMAMNLEMHKLSLRQFFGNTRFAATTKGYFGGKINLKGQGKSLADVLATSNGELTIIMSGGTISNLLIEASDLDLGQALPLFLGEDKSVGIRCGVMDFDVKNGVLGSKAFLLDTTDTLLLGNVGVDLKRELINAKLDARPKDASLFSAQTPITVKGPLKKPSIGLDATKAGARGAVAVVAGTLLTPFAALLAFIETGDEKNVDCRTMISRAEK